MVRLMNNDFSFKTWIQLGGHQQISVGLKSISSRFFFVYTLALKFSTSVDARSSQLRKLMKRLELSLAEFFCSTLNQ